MAKVYLSLGSNVGDKKTHINNAIELIEEHNNIESCSISSYYLTEPVGYQEQDWFVNIAMEIETSLDPHTLIKYFKKIEKDLQRIQTIRWGPRTIDIDILLYDNLTINDQLLTIPHEMMEERAFVMIPLWEIAPNIFIKGKHISEIVADLEEQKIEKLD